MGKTRASIVPTRVGDEGKGHVMVACAHDERRVGGIGPFEDWRDRDEAYCALVELEELYVGRSAQRRILFDRWLSVAYWRRSAESVAAASRSRRTGETISAAEIRRQIRRVATALRMHYGPPVGNPVEQILGFASLASE